MNEKNWKSLNENFEKIMEVGKEDIEKEGINFRREHMELISQRFFREITDEEFFEKAREIDEEPESIKKKRTSRNNITVDSEMNLWNHTLKFDAILGLLYTIDKKDYIAAGKLYEFNKYIKELEEALKKLRN